MGRRTWRIRPRRRRIRAESRLHAMPVSLGRKARRTRHCSPGMMQHTNVRREAIIELGELGDTRAVQPCINALRDGDDTVRRHAACALGNFGDVRAVMPLIAALSDKGMEVGWCAARSLGKLGDVRAVEPLIDLLNTSMDMYTRQEAAQSLGKIGDDRALEPLVRALNDKDKYVRRAAAAVLGDLGNAQALPALIATERQDHVATNQANRQGIREAAAKAIARIEARHPTSEAARIGDNRDLAKA